MLTADRESAVKDYRVTVFLKKRKGIASITSVSPLTGVIALPW